MVSDGYSQDSAEIADQAGPSQEAVMTLQVCNFVTISTNFKHSLSIFNFHR